MSTRLVALPFVVCLFVSLTGAAQDRGTLSGVVLDAAGGPLAGVGVLVEGPDTRAGVTDERGAFSFANLRPGSYRVQLTRAGFKTAIATVQLGTGPMARTFRMVAGEMSEQITVTADASPEVTAPGRTRHEGAPLPQQAVRGGVVGGIIGGIPGTAAASVARSPLYRQPVFPYPGGESYGAIDENPFRSVVSAPLSTFSVDVDTASYSNVRRFLNEGQMPPVDGVRIEEMINYFRYDYPQPDGSAPFSVTAELSDCPWNPKHRLALIALQSRRMPEGDAPPRNLVFLVDVSGSMQSADKLPLVRSGLRLLTDILTEHDRVAIVVYAGSSGLVLPPTRGNDRGRIHRAIAELEAGGSTNGGQGIELAYRVAREHFIKGGINRVILATNGDFNVGITDQSALVRLIEEQRKSGVFLSVLGVGTGNLKDSTMEQLADKGNGNYAYLDSLQEARRVLVREAGSTLVTIAKDVKLQVEFNPRHVAGYRLIGYENRLLRNEDFNDDSKDAGEIGAGHSVTALYEIVPAGVPVPGPPVDPLKYQSQEPSPSHAASNELLTVKVRYKAPDADESTLLARTLTNTPQPSSANLGFASAVAELGLLLRGSPQAPAASFAQAIARARKFRLEDADGYRAEFIKLAELASALAQLATAPTY